MRARIERGTLFIDLLHTPDQIANVVRLVTAAGLVNVGISDAGEGPSIAVNVDIPNGWASEVLPAVLEVAAVINGRGAEETLAQWRESASDFRDAAKVFDSPANG